MKNDKQKIREPYPPENTPNPPQNIDPNLPGERENQNKPVENKRPGNDQKEQNKKSVNAKPKLLGESETEITDETTI
jgi:hypothetical protein